MGAVNGREKCAHRGAQRDLIGSRNAPRSKRSKRAWHRFDTTISGDRAGAPGRPESVFSLSRIEGTAATAARRTPGLALGGRRRNDDAPAEAAPKGRTAVSEITGSGSLSVNTIYEFKAGSGVADLLLLGAGSLSPVPDVSDGSM